MSDLIERLRKPVAYGPVGAQAERDEAADELERSWSELLDVESAHEAQIATSEHLLNRIDQLEAELEQETALKVGYYNQAAEGWQKFREAERRIEQLETNEKAMLKTIDTIQAIRMADEKRIEQLEAGIRKVHEEIDEGDHKVILGRLIAGISNLSDSPKPIDSDESESVACPRCGVEFPHRCEYDPD